MNITSLILFIHILIYSSQTFLVDKQIAERIYLHLDRNIYSSGDDIWFKAYIIDPATNKLSLNTNNLYVELIGENSQIIQSRIVRIYNGLGKGDFKISDNISTGVYRIRAYTNFMQNYGADNYFIKKIKIINPVNVENELQDTIINNEKIIVSIFPEGGSLIENVTSKIAYKAVDLSGKGCNVDLDLFTSDSIHIATFHSNHLGMGFFYLKPLQGFSYYVIVRSGNIVSDRTFLPQIFSSGIVMSAEISFDKNLLMAVYTNQLSLKSLLGKELTLTLSLRNLVVQKVLFKIDSLENRLRIPLNDFPDGIIRITIGEYDGFPLAERLIFNQKVDVPDLVIKPDKSVYKPREKVNLILSIDNGKNFAHKGWFSMAVVQTRDLDQFSDQGNIATWFLLQSDIRGDIESPSYYFNLANLNRLKDLDLLLLTQGWRDFKWKYDTINHFEHEVGFKLHGQLKSTISEKPIQGAKVNLGLFSQKGSQFYETLTDNNGQFWFEQIEFYGKVEIFISSTDKNGRQVGKLFVDTAKHSRPELNVSENRSQFTRLIGKEIVAYKTESGYQNEIKKKYKLKDTLVVGEVFITAERVKSPQEIKVSESRRLYTEPDRELIVPNEHFNYGGDVFSYMSGRLPGVRITRAVNPCSLYYPDDVQIYVRGQYIERTNCQKQKIKLGALILLDGYEVDSASLGSILSLPMNTIDRIDVISNQPTYGMRGANGVINIITKNRMERGDPALGENSKYLVLKGFDTPRIFYSPDYEKNQTSLMAPDFRSTIFWDPDIEISDSNSIQKKFFNDDQNGEIKIVVEGITDDGIPLITIIPYLIQK